MNSKIMGHLAAVVIGVGFILMAADNTLNSTLVHPINKSSKQSNHFCGFTPIILTSCVTVYLIAR